MQNLTKVITIRGGNKVHLTIDALNRDSLGYLTGVATLCKSRYGASVTQAEFTSAANYEACPKCERLALKLS